MRISPLPARPSQAALVFLMIVTDSGTEPMSSDDVRSAEAISAEWVAAQRAALNSSDAAEATRSARRLGEDALRLYNTRLVLEEVALHGPGLGLAAQAFLFVVIFGQDTPPIGRVAAALVALLAAYASAKALSTQYVVSWRMIAVYQDLRRLIEGDDYKDGLDAFYDVRATQLKAVRDEPSQPPVLSGMAFRLNEGLNPQLAWLLAIVAFALVDGVLLVMTVLEWAGVGTSLSG